MKKIIVYILLFLSSKSSFAQDFLSRGTIEFEMKLSTKRMYGEMTKGRDDRFNMSDVPEFQVMKRKLLFDGDKMLYTSEEKNNFMPGSALSVYTDLGNAQSFFKGGFMVRDLIFKDSIEFIRWKIEDETRVIAGFKCRKAIGVILDSVYVVAFYCPEIIPQGGPEMFAGLPGMILGLAVPRLFSTWFATKITQTVDGKLLAPPVPAKKEKILTMEECRKQFKDIAGSFRKAKLPDDALDYLLKGLMLNYLFTTP